MLFGDAGAVVADAEFDNAIRAAADQFNALPGGRVFQGVLGKVLDDLHEFVAAHQDLTVVVDHAAKPTTRRRPARFAGFESWAADMTSLARFPNTWCKLSGLVTEAEVGAATDDFAPVVDLLLATFGPRRLLWGSDWPVATIACDYSEWFAICERLLAPLDREDLEAVLGGNATRCYRLASRIPELAHDNSPAGNP